MSKIREYFWSRVVIASVIMSVAALEIYNGVVLRRPSAVLLGAAFMALAASSFCTPIVLAPLRLPLREMLREGARASIASAKVRSALEMAFMVFILAGVVARYAFKI